MTRTWLSCGHSCTVVASFLGLYILLRSQSVLGHVVRVFVLDWICHRNEFTVTTWEKAIQEVASLYAQLFLLRCEAEYYVLTK